MNRSTMMGLVTGSLLGATVGLYAASQMSPRDRKKALKTTKRMLSKATSNMLGMGIF